MGTEPQSEGVERKRTARRPAYAGEPPGRRRFDNLYTELSVALGIAVPRFELWMELHECDLDPERLTREEAIAFCDGPLESYLRRRGLSIRRRALRRLCRKVRKFDPDIATPYERFAALP